jgi:uncharacterized membrane protein
MGSLLGKYVQKPATVFLILASIFGILSAFIVPQLSVPDENMHLLRSYTIASGHLAGNDKNECVFPKAVYDRAYSIYDGDYKTHYRQEINLSDVGKKVWCGTAASYSPIVYGPQVVGVTAAKLIHPSLGVMILFGRLASIAFYIGALYYIIKKVRIGKWAFAVIALLPTAIQQAASLSADGVTYVTTFALVAFLINLATQKTSVKRRQLLVLLLLAAALTLTKAPNIVLLLLIPFLPSRIFSYKFNKASLLLKPVAIKWYAFIASGVFALLCALLWQKIYGQPLLAPVAGNPIPHHPWQFIPILFRTYVYMDPHATIYGFTGLGGFGDFILSSVVGGFASYRYWLPEILVFTCYLLLIFVSLRTNKAEDKLLGDNGGRLASGGIISLGALVVGVSYSLYIMWALPLLGPTAIYAAGVQGRYFTAALVLLVPAAVWVRGYISIQVKSDVMFGGIVATTSGFLLLFYTLQTLYAIHLGVFR